MTLPPGSDIRRVSTAERNRRIHQAWDAGCFTKHEIARICGLNLYAADKLLGIVYERKAQLRAA